MTLYTAGGAFYVRADDGRRTRLYINPEAAQRAVTRDELYTDAEYAALTAQRTAKRRRTP